METYTTICKNRQPVGICYTTQGTKSGLCDNLAGCKRVGGGSRGKGHMNNL